MNRFSIVTDSGCDVSRDILRSWDVKNVDLTFSLDDSGKTYTNQEIDAHGFYERMRSGACPKTSCPSPEAFIKVFEDELSKGNDVLYIGFSSGLSGTYNTAAVCIDELKAKYPERKIIPIDSLCASAGLALLVNCAVDMRASGSSIIETADKINDIKNRICHWYTVDDLIYLKRGGRINAAVAMAANILSIKPLMHMNDSGKLENVSKVRGRKHVIRALAEKYIENAVDPSSGIFYISHGDCMSDAEMLNGYICSKTGNNAKIISDIGPIIGAHSGPGTLALFYIGKER